MWQRLVTRVWGGNIIPILRPTAIPETGNAVKTAIVRLRKSPSAKVELITMQITARRHRNVVLSSSLSTSEKPALFVIEHPLRDQNVELVSNSVIQESYNHF